MQYYNFSTFKITPIIGMFSMHLSSKVKISVSQGNSHQLVARPSCRDAIKLGSQPVGNVLVFCRAENSPLFHPWAWVPQTGRIVPLVLPDEAPVNLETNS